ncbi:MAG: DNA recombination protein RmuC [Actinobacteria bacterium]|nr:DNA recombination protein RmuC [Actinomycetota bacterium]
MDPLLVFSLTALACALLALLAVSRRAGQTVDPVSGDLAMVRAEVQRLSQHVSAETLALGQRLEGIDSRMSLTHSTSAKMASDIFDTLGDVRRATTSVAEQAREFSSLQDLLKAPKARGGMGEAMLEELLRQVLPPGSFSTQHRFRSGATVDVVVKAGGRLVCIDSKFPLANYRRMCDSGSDIERAEAERAFAGDVQQHIRAISERYVVPDENTFDFAVMYVPAEGVYAEVLRLSHRKRPLFETAMEMRVVPMSPLTLYGYLQTILLGLKCLSIEKNAEEILDFCGRLEQDMGRFAAEYEVLGRHLGNARTKYEDGARRLDHLRDKLDQAVDLSAEEPAALEAVAD